MKNLILIVFFSLLTLNIKAQTEVEWNPQPQLNSFNDTLIVKLNKDVIIYITGAKLAYINSKQQQIDTLLIYLKKDIESSIKENLIPENATELVYLYKTATKRRLKVESPEYSDREIDIEYEIFRMQNNIPPVRLRIIDLNNQLQYQIYTTSLSKLLVSISELQLDEYLQSAFENKKAVYNSTEVTVKKNSNNQVEAQYNTYKQHVVDAQPSAGVMLIGGEIGAGFGLNLMYKKVNKYHFATRKYGLGFFMTSLYQFNDGNMGFAQSYDFIYMRLLSEPKKSEIWSGFQIGMANFDYSEWLPKLSLTYSNSSGITWMWDSYFSFDTGLIIGFTAKFPL
jgi:hypothetical protein